MDKKRVVVTGLGALTPLGNDVETTWKNAVAGVSGVGPITRVDSSEYTAKVAAELKDFNIEDYMEKKEARKMARFTQYAVVAAQKALEDSRLEITDENAPRVGYGLDLVLADLKHSKSNSKCIRIKEQDA